MPRLLRPLLALSLVTLASPALAGGWQEAHQTSDDVRIAVGPDGVATMEHRLRYRVVAGRFKSFDVTGIEPGAVLEPQAVAIQDKGNEIPAHVEADPKTPGTVKISFDDGLEPKKSGLTRGSYVVAMKYKLDLVAAKMLVRDGAMWRLAWTAAPANEGRDGARVVFELPPAPTEPRLAAPEQAQTTLATLRRQADKDELELVRAHVPRGEAVVWSARVDPKAFPKVAAPELKPRVIVDAVPEDTSRTRLALAASALATIAGLFAFALRRKGSAASSEAAARGAIVKPLVRVPWGLGPYAYGATSAAAIASLLWGTPLYGALLVVVAMALAVHRAPERVTRPRGPGRWTPVADAEVFAEKAGARRPGDVFDPTTRAGRLALAMLVVVVAALAYGLRAIVPGAAIAFPLASAALVPLFVTATRAQMPKTPEELATTFLRPTRDALGVLVDLAHVELGCVARLRERTREVDEVRLSCAPGDRIPGLRTIELALATTARAAQIPEVLVRFDDASPAAAKIAHVAAGVPIVTGRATEEKVLRLRPSTPTPVAAARLVARLLDELEGRRATDRKKTPVRYDGPERRVALTAFRAALATP